MIVLAIEQIKLRLADLVTFVVATILQRRHSTDRAACAFLHQDLPALEGRLCGQVFECDHSYLPEGCGQTVHCSGCTIRRAITETYATGRSRYRLAVTLLQRTPTGLHDLRLLISTQRIGKVVFMRMDATD